MKVASTVRRGTGRKGSNDLARGLPYYVEYRCLQCGQGKHRVAMSCKSSLCLRCAKVTVDNWVSQVSTMLHEGVIYRHIILTVPAMFRTTFYHHAAVVLSASMRCGVPCLDDFSSEVRGKTSGGAPLW